MSCFNSLLIHVPRTGGTAIRITAFNNEKLKPKILTFGDKFGHGSASFASKVLRDQFNDLFSFGFVRNPWDRMVSYWFHQKLYTPRKQLEFEEFIEKKHCFISPCTTMLFENGKPKVSFIGRFENLEEDWAECSKIICGEEIPLIDNKVLESVGKNGYRQYYTPRAKSMVEKIYKDDIENFGYKYAD